MIHSTSAVVARAGTAAALAGVWLAATAAPVSPLTSPAGPVPGVTPAHPARTSGPGFVGVTEHVIVVSIDGLRPDAIEAFGAETLLRLMREGSYSLQAQTIFPSITLPSHTSMLTGVGPSRHGVTWNSNRMAERGPVQVPTIFELTEDAGLHAAAFFSKSKFHHLEREGSLDYSQAPAHDHEFWLATRTVPDAVNYLRHRRPNLLFVHIGEPDFAGHATGWMGRVYGWAVRRADAGVAALIRAADETFGPGGYTVIISSDHGGHGRTHGSKEAVDMTIPWITWGAGVQPGRIADPIRTMDTAATALWLLGIAVPPDWAGAPVAAGYSAAARLAASRARSAAAAAAPAEAGGHRLRRRPR